MANDKYAWVRVGIVVIGVLNVAGLFPMLLTLGVAMGGDIKWVRQDFPLGFGLWLTSMVLSYVVIMYLYFHRGKDRTSQH